MIIKKQGLELDGPQRRALKNYISEQSIKSEGVDNQRIIDFLCSEFSLELSDDSKTKLLAIADKTQETQKALEIDINRYSEQIEDITRQFKNYRNTLKEKIPKIHDLIVGIGDYHENVLKLKENLSRLDFDPSIGDSLK